MEQVRNAEREMEIETRGHSPATAYLVECFLIAAGEINDPENRLCRLNHLELERSLERLGMSYFDRLAEEPHGATYLDRLYGPKGVVNTGGIVRELVVFHERLVEIEDTDLFAMSDREKALFQAVIDRVYCEWEKFKVVHEQFVCQYIACE